MDLLTFKLIVTPTLIVVVSLAARRWGPKLGGLLTGLPLTSAPVLVFLALEQGSEFATTAGLGILSGIASVGVFCLAYAVATKRWPWPACALAGVACFFCTTAILRGASLGLIPATVLTTAVLSAVLALFPQAKVSEPAARPPPWDLPARAATATAMVLALTAASPALGARMSGLLAPFPAFALVLAAFTHAQRDADASRLFLRGIVLASFASTGFFMVAGLSFRRLQPAPTLLLATFAALVIGGTIYRLDQQKPTLSARDLG